MAAPAFGILGVLEVRRNGLPTKVGGRRRRQLLAYLLVNAGSRVSLDRICDAVWEGDPPEGAVATVRSYVSQFRKLVSPPGLVVEADPTGYRLSLHRDELDATRFEDQVASARRLDDLVSRVAALEDALTLWRGPALVEFTDASWAATAAQRLASIRELAIKERFEALLALGRHSECVVPLEEAVGEAPFDEQLAVLLAVARYRSGQVSGALREVVALSRRLGEELGLSPGAEVMDLERRMLDRDPALDVATTAFAGVRDSGPTDGAEDRLPQGTVTFFFTDTEGSTKLVRKLGDERYAEVLATQRGHLSNAVQHHGGVVFGSEGDALFCAFSSASAAVSAAIDAQRTLDGETWPEPLRTRIGLHTGEALVVGDDYVGATVHLVARVSNAADGGQIVASEACRSLVPDAGMERSRLASTPGHRPAATALPTHC